MVELFAILAFRLVFEPTICGFMIFVTTYSAFLMLHFSTSSCCWLCLGSGSFGQVCISLGHVLNFLLPFLPMIFFVTFTDEGLSPTGCGVVSNVGLLGDLGYFG